MGVLHLPSSVLQRPSSNIRNNIEVYFRSLTWVYCICHQVVCISYHVNQEPHMVYQNHIGCQSSVLHMPLCTSEASLGCTALPSSVLQRPSFNIRNNTGVYFRSLTWVYCICHQVYCRGHHITSGTTLRCHFRSLTWVCCICHQVYCRGHHLTSGKILGCTSGASLGCTAFAIKCTAEAII